jgi:Ca2+-binding RTX toxin-like protein
VQCSGTKSSYTLGANLEDLVLVSGTTATGNALNNQIDGNFLNNKLLGLAGDDTLDGGVGDDTLTGGTGKDSLIGGAGSDLYIVDNAADRLRAGRPGRSGH